MDKSGAGSIGGRIREIRLNAGLTQTEFGQKVGVSLPTVNRIEQNQRSPQVELLVEVSRRFSVDLSWLLVGGAEKKDTVRSGSQIPLFAKLSQHLIENASEDVESLLSLPDVPPGAVSCRCFDDACAPEINSGDIVIFVPGECDLNDTVVVCDQWGNGLVRRVQKQGTKIVYVASHSGYELLGDEEVSPLGVVWGLFRKF